MKTLKQLFRDDLFNTQGQLDDIKVVAAQLDKYEHIIDSGQSTGNPVIDSYVAVLVEKAASMTSRQSITQIEDLATFLTVDDDLEPQDAVGILHRMTCGSIEGLTKLGDIWTATVDGASAMGAHRFLLAPYGDTYLWFVYEAHSYEDFRPDTFRLSMSLELMDKEFPYFGVHSSAAFVDCYFQAAPGQDGYKFSKDEFFMENEDVYSDLDWVLDNRSNVLLDVDDVLDNLTQTAAIHELNLDLLSLGDTHGQATTSAVVSVIDHAGTLQTLPSIANLVTSMATQDKCNVQAIVAQVEEKTTGSFDSETMKYTPVDDPTLVTGSFCWNMILQLVGGVMTVIGFFIQGFGWIVSLIGTLISAVSNAITTTKETVSQLMFDPAADELSVCSVWDLPLSSPSQLLYLESNFHKGATPEDAPYCTAQSRLTIGEAVSLDDWWRALTYFGVFTRLHYRESPQYPYRAEATGQWFIPCSMAYFPVHYLGAINSNPACATGLTGYYDYIFSKPQEYATLRPITPGIDNGLQWASADSETLKKSIFSYAMFAALGAAKESIYLQLPRVDECRFELTSSDAVDLPFFPPIDKWDDRTVDCLYNKLVWQYTNQVDHEDWPSSFERARALLLPLLVNLMNGVYLRILGNGEEGGQIWWDFKFTYEQLYYFITRDLRLILDSAFKLQAKRENSDKLQLFVDGYGRYDECIGLKYPTAGESLMKALYTTLITIAGVAVVGLVAGFATKRILRTIAYHNQEKRAAKLSAAKTAYDTDPSAKNSHKLYRAQLKMNRANARAGKYGLAAVNQPGYTYTSAISNDIGSFPQPTKVESSADSFPVSLEDMKRMIYGR